MTTLPAWSPAPRWIWTRSILPILVVTLGVALTACTRQAMQVPSPVEGRDHPSADHGGPARQAAPPELTPVHFHSVALSADGRTLAATAYRPPRSPSGGWLAMGLDTYTRGVLWSREVDAGTTMRLSPDGRFAALFSGPTLLVCSGASGADVARGAFRSITAPNLATISPDGRLAAAADTRSVALLDTRTGAETAIRLPHAPGSVIQALEFDTEGAAVLVGTSGSWHVHAVDGERLFEGGEGIRVAAPAGPARWDAIDASGNRVRLSATGVRVEGAPGSGAVAVSRKLSIHARSQARAVVRSSPGVIWIDAETPDEPLSVTASDSDFAWVASDRGLLLLADASTSELATFSIDESDRLAQIGDELSGLSVSESGYVRRWKDGAITLADLGGWVSCATVDREGADIVAVVGGVLVKAGSGGSVECIARDAAWSGPVASADRGRVILVFGGRRAQCWVEGRRVEDLDLTSACTAEISACAAEPAGGGFLAGTLQGECIRIDPPRQGVERLARLGAPVRGIAALGSGRFAAVVGGRVHLVGPGGAVSDLPDTGEDPACDIRADGEDLWVIRQSGSVVKLADGGGGFVAEEFHQVPASVRNAARTRRHDGSPRPAAPAELRHARLIRVPDLVLPDRR